MILIQDDQSFLTRLNKTGVTVNRCQVVSTDAKEFELASASSQHQTINVLGLIDDKHAIDDTVDVGRIQTHGVLKATAAEWENAGIVGGLVAGTAYYVSTVAGDLTATKPTAAGHYIRQVGIAISTTELLIDRVGFERVGTSFSFVGNQPLISSGNSIVEAGEMFDGALLIGASGQPPVPSTLAAGNGIVIGTGPSTILISADQLVVPVTSLSATLRGQVVYWSSTGTPPAMDLAQANAAGTTRVVGLIHDSSLDSIQSEGLLDLPTTSWDLVNGSSGGLTPGATYYLSPTNAGALVTTAPTTAGQFLVVVGVALNTTQLLLRIREPIGL